MQSQFVFQETGVLSMIFPCYLIRIGSFQHTKALPVNRQRWCSKLFDRFLVAGLLTLGFKALAAVHGTIATGLEGHLGGAAATVANHFEHLALSATLAALAAAAICAASMATAGLILETLFREESLLGSRKYEFGATLAAGQSLVLIHVRFPPKFNLTQTLSLSVASMVPKHRFWAMN